MESYGTLYEPKRNGAFADAGRTRRAALCGHRASVSRKAHSLAAIIEVPEAAMPPE